MEVLERLQCESQQDHLKLLQLATRVEHLELSSQSWPNFLQRELESRLLQEREMQRVLQTQGDGKGRVDGLVTLWLFNIAMENGPFIDDFPMKTFIYKGFSMAMLVITRW